MASFFRSLLGVEGQKAQDTVISIGMKLQGDAMEQAQVQTYVEAAHQASMVVGRKQQVLHEVQVKYQPDIDIFNKYKTAYDNFTKQLEAMGVDADNPGSNLTEQQTALLEAAKESLDKATELNAKRKLAQHQIEQAQQDLKDAQSDADHSAERATKASENLKEQHDQLERLKAEETRETERVHDAKVRSGLLHESDALHLVNDAYAKQIAERQARVDAAHQEAESLRRATHADQPEVKSSLLAAALAGGGTAVPVDAKSRRAALD